MKEDPNYEGREQTLVKHLILRNYLERFAYIVGQRWSTLTYVDCFAGPWEAKSEEFKDSSFAIALEILRNVQRDLSGKGRRNLQLRCFFLEKSRDAHNKLKAYADKVTDAMVVTRNATLEESIPNILEFVKQGGAQAFPFIFIDPTGWTGFAMETISPLLKLQPGEVLINFMTGHIRRFLDSPHGETQESFRRLFGSSDFKAKVQGLTGSDLEDAAVEEYTRNAKAVGGFDYASNAIVLHPEIDRTHFHLIYLTRHPKGVEVFKQAEKDAMKKQEELRADAQQRRRVATQGQLELFGGGELADSNHYDALRKRYSAKARDSVRNELESKGRLLYDDAWAIALAKPLSWENDLKRWVKEWKTQGLLDVEGMQPRQQVPHLKKNNFLVWK